MDQIQMDGWHETRPPAQPHCPLPTTTTEPAPVPRGLAPVPGQSVRGASPPDPPPLSARLAVGTLSHLLALGPPAAAAAAAAACGPRSCGKDAS
jgi:hypothetical protein